MTPQPKQYPSKDEILGSYWGFQPELIDLVTRWKTGRWNKIKDADIRFKKWEFYILIEWLCLFYKKPIAHLDNGEECYYDPNTQTIYLDNNGSIISCLHEFAHHLYGENELMACSWSVQLFKQVWPKAFAKLKWDGHMLKRETI